MLKEIETIIINNSALLNQVWYLIHISAHTYTLISQHVLFEPQYLWV